MPNPKLQNMEPTVANPPFNDSDWLRQDDDARWQFGVPPKANANFAWVQPFMAAAAPPKDMTLGDSADIHKRLREPQTVRINPSNLKSPYPVDASPLHSLKRDLLKRGGELAELLRGKIGLDAELVSWRGD